MDRVFDFWAELPILKIQVADVAARARALAALAWHERLTRRAVGSLKNIRGKAQAYVLTTYRRALSHH